MSNIGNRLLALLCLAALNSLFCSTGRADIFTVRQDDGSIVQVEARVYGEVRGAMLLLRDDGRIEFVPDARITEREPSEGPEPASPDEVASRLEKQFTPELTRTRVAGNHVVALVLQAPIESRAERSVKLFLNKVHQFVNNLDKNFEKWARSMGLPAEDPEFPLVMVIFETDAGFEAYAKESTSGGLSVGRLSGFYSHNTNWLAMRADECDSYALPLHEGIHQQVYNRGWYKRFAPVPVWFNEGVATGFENDGNRLHGDPSMINSMYATRSASRMTLTFPDVIKQDDAFRGDVLAGEAYTLAWALHWLVANTKKAEYTEFVKKQATLEPLQELSVEDRLSDFESLFGLVPAELQKTYELQLEKAAKRQRITPERPGPPGITQQQDQSGLVQIKAVMSPAGLSTQGTLKNISPFRDLAFRVRVVADNLPPIQWVVPGVRSGQQVNLALQTVPVQARTFRVEIRSAIPDSREAATW